MKLMIFSFIVAFYTAPNVNAAFETHLYQSEDSSQPGTTCTSSSQKCLTLSVSISELLNGQVKKNKKVNQLTIHPSTLELKNWGQFLNEKGAFFLTLKTVVELFPNLTALRSPFMAIDTKKISQFEFIDFYLVREFFGHEAFLDHYNNHIEPSLLNVLPDCQKLNYLSLETFLKTSVLHQIVSKNPQIRTVSLYALDWDDNSICAFPTIEHLAITSATAYLSQDQLSAFKKLKSFTGALLSPQSKDKNCTTFSLTVSVNTNFHSLPAPFKKQERIESLSFESIDIPSERDLKRIQGNLTPNDHLKHLRLNLKDIISYTLREQLLSAATSKKQKQSIMQGYERSQLPAPGIFSARALFNFLAAAFPKLSVLHLPGLEIEEDLLKQLKNLEHFTGTVNLDSEKALLSLKTYDCLSRIDNETQLQKILTALPKLEHLTIRVGSPIAFSQTTLTALALLKTMTVIPEKSSPTLDVEKVKSFMKTFGS